MQDLEDELIGYNTRLDKFKEDIDNKNKDIDDYKIKISEAKKLIKKYKDQQMNVRNNREYDAISKEIESQELDTKLFVKKSGENDQKIEGVKEEIKATKKIIKELEKLEKISFTSALTRKVVGGKPGKHTKTAVSRTVVVFDDFSVGDYVEHPIFGIGKVQALSGQGENQRVGIEFKDGLKKKLVVKFANLKKVDSPKG